MKKYYYKALYKDNTTYHVRSNKPLNANDICKTCVRLKKKNAVWYWIQVIIECFIHAVEEFKYMFKTTKEID